MKLGEGHTEENLEELESKWERMCSYFLAHTRIKYSKILIKF